MTPLVRARRFGQSLGMANLWIKDDGVNPTGSSKARSFSCAISMAVELNLRKVASVTRRERRRGAGRLRRRGGDRSPHVPAAGRAPGGLLGLRGLRRGGRAGREVAALDGWFDLGAFAEPYRVEGLKTLGYEIAEQLRWELPDAIVCPDGDGGGDRYLEGLRGDSRQSAGSQQAAQNDCGAGRGMPADCRCL